MIGVLGELAAEAELAARLRDLEQVEVAPPKLEAGLHAVAAADQRQRVGELKLLAEGIGRDELGVADVAVAGRIEDRDARHRRIV